MLLELKSHGKTEMEIHAKNIYNLCDSVFRLALNKTVSVELWGRVEQRKVRYMGWHLLVLSNTRPDNSEWMLWDNKYYIKEDQLVKILRFELDPLTLPRELIKEGREAPQAPTATTALLEAGSEFEQLRLNWRRIFEEVPADIKRTNAIALLRSAGAQPVDMEGGTVTLAFRYSIHKENMKKPENQQIAEKIISNFLGHPCRVHCICESEDDHLVQAALKMGAQIIDVEER